MTDKEQKMDGENSPPIFCCTLPFQNVIRSEKANCQLRHVCAHVLCNVCFCICSR